jgi:hypothetical protein
MNYDAAKILHDVSPDLANTVLDRCWDDYTVMLHLLGFMAEQMPDYKEKLEAYFDAIAKEEYDEDERLGMTT